MATRTVVTWRGLSITRGGDKTTPYHLADLKGWESTPSVTFDSAARPGGLGSYVTPGEADVRVVTLTGWCHDPELRDSLLIAIRDAGVPSVGHLVTESLTVSHAGLTLSADVQLSSAVADPEVGWGAGRFAFTLQWRGADPLRYGPQSSTVVPITVPTLGITFPISGDWVFPVDPVGGPASVLNPGNAATDAAFTLTGALSSPGVVVLETGKKVTFDFDLAATDSLVIDTAQGLCTLNGEYRSPTVASALLDEMRLPAAGLSTVQPLGTPLSGSPSLSVTYRPAYW